MDFGGFIVFALLVMGLFAGSIVLAIAFAWRSPFRWLGVRLWLCSLIVVFFAGRYLYHVYFLDEPLFFAASKGDIAEVNRLLAAGACPNPTWEDGSSALSRASAGGHRQVVLALENAGASW